ncbi:MAG: helix-turn-helix transcriptional regulator [Clostridia bacterium]|nr:helix-turn-helix transcriptional regulator [Clostridia bacterium]
MIMSGIDSDLIRGHIDTIILKVLFEGDKYGIEICKEVEEKSGGTYELKQPTLYSCLKRLENQGLISSYWTDSDIGGKRHYYKLTDQGKDTYRHNQEEWQRSRQIIDNLISNTYADASSYALVKKDEIEDLEEKAEKAEQQLEEIQEKIDDGTLVEIEEDETVTKISEDNVEENTTSNITEMLSVNDDEEIIPWTVVTEEKEDDKQEEDITYSWTPEIDVRETEDQSVLVSYAPNGEELAAVVTEKDEEQVEEFVPFEEVDEAQSSIFEDTDDVFGADLDVEKLEEQYSPEEIVQSVVEEETTEEQEVDAVDTDDDNFDILELLGHTVKNEVSPTLAVEDEPQEEIEEAVEEVQEEEVSPFSFRMEDFVSKSKNSYFESQEVLDPTPDYTAPEMKIDGIEEKEEVEEDFSNIEFIEDEEDSADDIYEPEQDSSTPVYHDFGASSFEQNFNHKIEQDDEENNDDEIYSPFVQEKDETEKTAIVDDELKLFSEDLFEDNEDYVVHTEDKTEEQEQDCAEDKTVACKIDYEDVEIQSNQQLMDFYKSTENYDNITPKYTDEEYKEKLTSIITYGNYDKQDDAQEKEVNIDYTAPSKEVFNQSAMDYTELKTDFEKEGLVVRPHYKMVKESKHTRSYIESNKLNMINSWTAFSIIAFIVSLTYLIMSNYDANTYGYDFSYKYFLIGICCLAIIPIIYTMIYFINPYKKKPARYASRIYTLFAILLTVQLYIIIYCINLQLGFYSFAQPNYNHLLWIVPCLLSLYPLADAILHTVYFNSKNFHV